MPFALSCVLHAYLFDELTAVLLCEGDLLINTSLEQLPPLKQLGHQDNTLVHVKGRDEPEDIQELARSLLCHLIIYGLARSLIRLTSARALSLCFFLVVTSCFAAKEPPLFRHSTRYTSEGYNVLERLIQEMLLTFPKPPSPNSSFATYLSSYSIALLSILSLCLEHLLSE